MQSLEKTLADVEWLRRNLRAEIILQEGEEGRGHYESVEVYDELSDTSAFYGMSHSQEQWVFDESGKPRITEPDIKKREKAEQQLQHLYDSSEWYSGRYEAGRALGKSSAELDSQINTWLELLKEKALLPKTYQVAIGECLVGFENDEWGNHFPLTSIVYEERPIPENIELKRNAVKDIIKLYQLSKSPKAKETLRGIYKTKNQCWFWGIEVDNRLHSDKEEITEAGKALGYNGLRIWAYEHPRITSSIIFGVAVIVPTTIAIILKEYLSR